ncbi:hypothetical protein QBC39DRAFT_33666 [Podospora conica]|nr:hypothetical protein QBC39DRAFT_33666 [Schizothecium conicum]
MAQTRPFRPVATTLASVPATPSRRDVHDNCHDGRPTRAPKPSRRRRPRQATTTAGASLDRSSSLSVNQPCWYASYKMVSMAQGGTHTQARGQGLGAQYGYMHGAAMARFVVLSQPSARPVCSIRPRRVRSALLSRPLTPSLRHAPRQVSELPDTSLDLCTAPGTPCLRAIVPSPRWLSSRHDRPHRSASTRRLVACSEHSHQAAQAKPFGHPLRHRSAAIAPSPNTAVAPPQAPPRLDVLSLALSTARETPSNEYSPLFVGSVSFSLTAPHGFVFTTRRLFSPFAASGECHP